MRGKNRPLLLSTSVCRRSFHLSSRRFTVIGLFNLTPKMKIFPESFRPKSLDEGKSRMDEATAWHSYVYRSSPAIPSLYLVDPRTTTAYNGWWHAMWGVIDFDTSRSSIADLTSDSSESRTTSDPIPAQSELVSGPPVLATALRYKRTLHPLPLPLPLPLLSCLVHGDLLDFPSRLLF
ncbi:uncharacterized protein LOC127257660 [Andrographis paniculata]|uniref:uncharacterized protein LOC127257660 n=1 Tax=Andrographis paniculata TaxID=175694 RepID=UPI0021E6D9D1|nr:uncharacterized protein LOC127257660 [Andrographis paniculata]